MADFFINTSYNRKYTVVATTKDGVILRPIVEEGADPIPSYWKEFIRENTDEPIPEDALLTVNLTQLPSEVISVDAYVEYVVEYPRVEVRVGNISIDVSDRISCNHPNPETPGLYALDFMLPIDDGTGYTTQPIWRSWVSIDEPPILRRVITPWNRESRTIADLNRLVIEPQFMEALYEAGVPLYNFQQANAPAAVSQFYATSYKAARAFVRGGRLFISGPQLPVGTEVVVNGVKRVLGVKVLVSPFGQFATYTEGDIVSYGGNDYYALMDIPKHEVPNPDNPEQTREGSIIPDTYYDDDGTPTLCWISGVYYLLDEPIGGMPDGEYEITSLWSVIDVGGYLFKMDLLRAFPVRHYWGHYDRKYFYDYAPGDLVSVVSNNVISLYQRNETSISEKDLEEAYRPGHYKNPHWTEVYSASNDSMLRDPAIIPYTNATNAVVSKTYPVRGEAFRIYARLVGMPVELINAMGSKYSVLLWAMLYRTRETYPGFRSALRAIGLDAEDLHRETPSVKYFDSDGTEIKNIYTEIDKVKQIAESVKADKVWTGSGDPNTSDMSDPRNTVNADIPWIRYSRPGEDADVVWAWSLENSEWTPIYSFKHIGSDRDVKDFRFDVNNRYYRATVNLLDRLAEDCAVIDENQKQWIDHNYFGSIASSLAELLGYEIPIYIYFRLKVNLIAIGRARVNGVSGAVGLLDAWGGAIGLKLFPSKYFDFITMSVKYYYPKLLFSYTKLDTPYDDDTGWIEYMDYVAGNGFRYFPFEQAVYIRLKFVPTETGIVFKEDADGKWISKFTIGCLGNDGSSGTGDYKPNPDDHGFSGFMDATQMGSGADLYLCKGLVGCTMRIAPSQLTPSAECLQYQYIFDRPEEWVMDEILKFGGWKPIGVKMLGYWSGPVSDFKTAVVRITSSDISQSISFKWVPDDPATMLIGGGAPKLVYLWDWRGYLLGMLQFDSVDNLITDPSEVEVDGTGFAPMYKVTFDA